MSDAPPAWPPFYDHGGWFRLGSDEPQFRIKGKYEFEFIDPDRGDDPALAAAWYAEDLAQHVAGEPTWRATGGWVIEPGSAGRAGAVHSTPFVARHSASDATVEGRVALTPDPSHWVKVEVFLGAFRVFVAYLDKPWEEYDLWPSRAVEKTDEVPGRIGKRRNWANLSAAAWPALAHVADQGWFSVELPDL
ncbi:MAG: hypothetical protein M9939_24970 [Mesorhizobium sp.]|nr:hypothetical protein [Mesorhizobium sp.]MCO5164346.1 hypothetical protein [Mesorhizobium sp.]